MAGVISRTEDWNSLSWKSIQRNVFRLQKRIYQAARVPMTMARILKSRMTRKCHVRFGSGGGVGDHPADHNLGCPLRSIHEVDSSQPYGTESHCQYNKNDTEVEWEIALPKLIVPIMDERGCGNEML